MGLPLTIESADQALAALQPLHDKAAAKASAAMFPHIAGEVNVQTVHYGTTLQGLLVLNSPYRYHWYCAGVGTGKSYMAAKYMFRRIFENWEPVGLACANTHAQLTQSTLPHFFTLLEEAGLQEDRDWVIDKRPPKSWKARNLFRRGYKDVISVKIARGKVAHILTRTLENYKVIRGITIGWGIIDEIADSKEEAWSDITERLRWPGLEEELQLLVLGMPAFPGDNWTFKEFSEGDPGDYRITFQSSTEAPHLSWKNYLLPLLRRLDPLRALQRIHGRIVINQTGRAYFGFRDGINNVLRFEYDPYRPIFFCFDFNIVSESPISAVLFQEHFFEGEIHVQVFDEIVIPGGDTIAAAQEFLSRYGNVHKSEIWAFGDASGILSQTVTEFKVLREVLHPYFAWNKRLFIPTIKQNPRVFERVAAVNAKLRNSLGVSTLWICPKRCPETITDIKEIVPKGEGQLDKSDKARTHCTDGLGYGICIRFPPWDPPQNKAQYKAAV